MAKDKQPAQTKAAGEDLYKQFKSVLQHELKVTADKIDSEDAINDDMPTASVTLSPTLLPATDPTTLVVKAEDFDGTTTLLPSVPGDRFRDGADPTMVKAYSILERIQVGGLLSQWAGTVYVDISELLPEMRKAVMA